MRVIAYQYEADYACIGCTIGRFGVPGGVRTAADQPMLDEHGVPYEATDREGNPVHPLFDLDQWCDADLDGLQTLACGTCRGVIATCQHGPDHADEYEPEQGDPCECANCAAADAYPASTVEAAE